MQVNIMLLVFEQFYISLRAGETTQSKANHKSCDKKLQGNDMNKPGLPLHLEVGDELMF